jgi:hypothetical protein
MSEDRWHQQIERIYQDALKITPEKRDSFLEETCRDAPDLKRDVEALLAANWNHPPGIFRPNGVRLNLEQNQLVRILRRVGFFDAWSTCKICSFSKSVKLRICRI